VNKSIQQGPTASFMDDGLPTPPRRRPATRSTKQLAPRELAEVQCPGEGSKTFYVNLCSS